MRDPGKVMQSHIDLQKESPPNMSPRMRKCAGCRRNRSVGQFSGANDCCLQCVRRAPRVAA